MRNLVRVLSLVMTLTASMSLAQTQATVCPYPLDVLRPPKGASAAQLEDLRATFKRMIRESGVLLPNAGTLSDTLAELKRQDCDRENQCLVSLAVRSRSLYAMYASVDFEVGSVVSVTGRIVRDDGKEMARVAPLKAPATVKTFDEVSKNLLRQLLVSLEVSKLPAVKSVEAAKVDVVGPSPVVDAGVVASPPSPDAGVEFTPPPPPPLVTSPLKPVGIATASASGAVAAAGVALLLVGRGQAIPLFDDNGALKPGADVKAAQTARTLQGLGVGLAAVGLAGAAAGVVMVLLAPDDAAPKVSVAPLEGGGLVFVKGEF